LEEIEEVALEKSPPENLNISAAALQKEPSAERGKPSEIAWPIQDKELHGETAMEMQSNADYDAMKETLVAWQGELAQREKAIDERAREIEKKNSALVKRRYGVRLAILQFLNSRLVTWCLHFV
jgi:hypothetical protein